MIISGRHITVNGNVAAQFFVQPDRETKR